MLQGQKKVCQASRKALYGLIQVANLKIVPHLQTFTKKLSTSQSTKTATNAIMEKHKALKHKEKIHVNKVLVKRKNKGHKEEHQVTKFDANRKMEEGIPKKEKD